MTKKNWTERELDSAVAELEGNLGTDQIVAVRRGPGRPSLSDHVDGPAPTLNVRITHALANALDELSLELGRKKSELVREALEEKYLSTGK